MVHHPAIEPVQLLRRQYLQLVDLKRLVLPDLQSMRSPKTQQDIFEQLFTEVNLPFSPPRRYQFRVLKMLVSAMETAIIDPEEDEISDDISSLLATFMAQPLPPETTTAQEKCYVTYTAPSTSNLGPSVTLLENPSLLASSGTTGYRTWEAALHLASYLFIHSDKLNLNGKNVLELGAGTGLVSILCARYLKAAYVLATDGSRPMVNDMENNFEINGIQDRTKVKAAVLTWGHALINGVADLRHENLSFDLVLGADITYDTSNIPALVATMRQLFELYSHCEVLISATVRNAETVSVFINACSQSLTDPCSPHADTLAGASQFEYKEIEFKTPSVEEQIGFFHSTAVPIRLFSIKSTIECPDPFAPD